MALEALKGELTLAELAAKHGVHQTMIAGWNRQAIEGMAASFSGKPEAASAASPAEVDRLHAKIGQLVAERDFLAKPPAAPRGGMTRTGGIIAATTNVAVAHSTPSATQVNTSPYTSKCGTSRELKAMPAPIPEKAKPLTRPRVAGGVQPTTAAAISTISTPPVSPETKRQKPNQAQPQFSPQHDIATAVTPMDSSITGFAGYGCRHALINATPIK